MRFINYIKRFYEISLHRRKLDIDGTLLNAFKKKRVIFIHIPKTAGISLIRSIYGDVALGGHRDFHFYKSVLVMILINVTHLVLFEILGIEFIQHINS